VRVVSYCALAVAVCLLAARAWETIRQLERTDRIVLDQGQLNYRGAVWLLQGMHPYAPDNLLDPTVFYKLSDSLAKARGKNQEQLRKSFDDYWYSMDVAKKAPLLNDLEAAELKGKAAHARACLAYKYGPLMLLSYAPFVCFLGKAGIYVCHLFFLAAFLIVLYCQTKGRSPSFSFFFISFFFLISPHLGWNIFTLSATDLVAVFYPFLALLFGRQRKRFTAGLILGLALGVKLLPAALFIPCLLKPRQRRRTLLGILCGIVIWNIPMLVSEPSGFVCNYYLFNFLRPTDSTSFMHYLSNGWRTFVKVIALPALYLTLLYNFMTRESVTSWAYLFYSMALLFATGPILHNNYFVWFVPVLYGVLAVSMCPDDFDGMAGANGMDGRR
jgi:hypothetical protein